MADKNDTFKLNSESNDFNDRVNSIFGSLPQIKQSEDENEGSPRKDESSHSSSERFPSNERNRKGHPYEPYHNKRYQHRRPPRAPDHVLCPEKYTKYSLKNDGSSKISAGLTGDALNKKIALDFINDIKQQKEYLHESNSNDLDKDSKPCFKFSHKKTETEKCSETKSSSLFGSSHGGKAQVMGTFEFGKKQTKETKEKKSTVTTTTNSNVKLSYYDEEEEKEEE